jgi:hypothetical protein
MKSGIQRAFLFMTSTAFLIKKPAEDGKSERGHWPDERDLIAAGMAMHAMLFLNQG